MRFAQAHLPRQPRVLYACARRGARASVIAAYQYYICLPLGNAGGYCAYTCLGDQLYRYACARIGVLQIVYKLCQVFYRIYIVMRRRGYQRYAGRGVTRLGYPRVYLAAWQLTALAGLCALRHLYLYFIGIDQIVDCHAETSGCDLLYGRAAAVAVCHGLEPLIVLAAFARVGAPAQTVHRYGETLVRFLGYRAVAHCAGLEAVAYALHAFDIVYRYWAHARANLHYRAQCGLARLLIQVRAVLLKQPVIALAACLLQQVYGLRVKHMVLAVRAVLIYAAGFQLTVVFGKCLLVYFGALACNAIEIQSAHARYRAREELVYELAAQAYCLEYMRSAEGLHRGYAHLGQYLYYALHGGLVVVLIGIFAHAAAVQQFVYHVRVDRGNAAG